MMTNRKADGARASAIGAERGEPLASIGAHHLIGWERSTGGTGRVGIATLRLPGGKLGRFAIYIFTETLVEWWPTASLRRGDQAPPRQLDAALPVALALARVYDPEAFAHEGQGLLPTRRQTTDDGRA